MRAKRRAFEPQLDSIRFDLIMFLSQKAMHGTFGLLSPGKANNHSTVLPSSLPAPPPPPPTPINQTPQPPVCNAFVFPYHRPTILQQIDLESLTCARTHLDACRTHRGTHKSTQEWTRRDRKTVFLALLPARDRTLGLRTRIPPLKRAKCKRREI